MTAVVGDVLRITAIFQYLTLDFFSNQFYFKLTTQNEATDSLMMDKIADGLDSYYTFVNGVISDDIGYVNIEGQNVTQDVLLPPKLWPVLVNGGNVGECLPTQIAALVYYKTLRPRTRAAQYLPPMTETSNNPGGNMTAATVAAIQTFGDNMAAGILELSVEGDLGAYNPALARFTPVTLALVPTRWRTQRRRRLGVGS